MVKKFVPQKPKSIPFTLAAYQKMEKKFAGLTEERKNILTRLRSAELHLHAVIGITETERNYVEVLL